MLISEFQLRPEECDSTGLASQPVPLELGALYAEVGVGCGTAWVMDLPSLLNKTEKESVAVSILVASSGRAFG